MNREHHYRLTNTWKDSKGVGTTRVSAYDRSHTITIGNKPPLHLTTDNALYGDRSKLNPEDLLVSAISSCHMLSFLYLCAREGVVVAEYKDEASGIMIENDEGGGQFTEVVLNPVCTVTEHSMIEKAIALHHQAHQICYIAASVNFEVRNHPVCRLASEPD